MIQQSHEDDPVLESARRAEAALQRAALDLGAQAARDGRSLVVWRNNRVEHIDAAVLLREVDAQGNGESGE